MSGPRLTPEEAGGLVAAFRERSILVVGDVMLDEYVWGDTARISPEAPVPVVEVKRETLRPGGAANVARNIASLGGRAELLTVVGADSRADDLRSVLADEGIRSEGLLEDRGRPTTLKTRIIASRQQVVRVDRESRAPLTGEVRERFLDTMRARLEEVDGVIVSDYGKGIVGSGILDELVPAARRRGLFVAVDPKESNFERYRGVSVVTPNTLEASGAAKIAIRDEESLEEAGQTLLRDVDAEGVLVTRGPEGMSLFRRDEATEHIPVMAREVYDVTGAGDTVVATLTLARVSGASWLQAAVLSNAAAAVVVGKVGTATVAADELRNAVAGGYPAAPAERTRE